MTSDEQLSKEEGNSNSQTPGQMLKAAREQMGKSEADIAKQLHLNIDVVRALEADQYLRAPALIYMRGYMRTYAKAVGIPEEQILSAFDALHIKENREQFRVTFTKDSVIKISDSQGNGGSSSYSPSYSMRSKSSSLARWVGVLMVAALVTLVILWWRDGAVDKTGQHGTILGKTTRGMNQPTQIELKSQRTPTQTSGPAASVQPIPYHPQNSDAGNRLETMPSYPQQSTDNSVSGSTSVQQLANQPQNGQAGLNVPTPSDANLAPEIAAKPKPRPMMSRTRHQNNPSDTTQGSPDQNYSAQTQNLKPNYTVEPAQD